MTRYDAERLVRDLTGGQSPPVGTTLMFTKEGWQFVELPESLEPVVEREFVISEDEVDPGWAPEREGSLWLQVEPEPEE